MYTNAFTRMIESITLFIRRKRRVSITQRLERIERNCDLTRLADGRPRSKYVRPASRLYQL